MPRTYIIFDGNSIFLFKQLSKNINVFKLTNLNGLTFNYSYLCEHQE